jgi:cyclohexanone monooxygenase
MGQTQSAFTVNYPHMLDEQSKHLAYIVAHGIQAKARTIEVSEDAEREWVQTIVQLSRLSRDFLESCTPGYYNTEGKPGELSGQNSPYGGGPVQMFQLLARWRDEGELRGLEIA